MPFLQLRYQKCCHFAVQEVSASLTFSSAPREDGLTGMLKIHASPADQRTGRFC